MKPAMLVRDVRDGYRPSRFATTPEIAAVEQDVSEPLVGLDHRYGVQRWEIRIRDPYKAAFRRIVKLAIAKRDHSQR